jgi:hypothetical protein
MSRIITIAGAMGALWGLASAACAEPGAAIELPSPGHAAWRPVRFDSIDRHTHYAAVTQDGVDTVRADSDCAASAQVLAVAEIDLARTPILRWRWRVERGLDIADERSRAGDDFAARVYAIFRFDPERASLQAQIRRALASPFASPWTSQLAGDGQPGATLAFVWTSRLPVGTTWKNPFVDDVQMISLAQGKPAGWRDESVDLIEAFRGSVGYAPPGILAIGIMTDADNSCGRATGWYSEFRFTAAETTP